MRILALAAAAMVAGGSITGSAFLVAEAAEVKVQNADKLKAGLTKLYTKLDGSDTIGRSAATQEISNLIAGEKDKKNTALKATSWWSERILESLYAGDKYAPANPEIKKVVKLEVEFKLQGEDGPESRATVAYRGPNGYTRTKSSPMLLSIVDSKTDPKAWIEKSWVAQEDFAKDWVLVAVAESEAFDVTKDKIALMRVAGRMSRIFNVDVNRIFVEGVGAACKSAQLSAAWAGPDRIAGLVLRNPAEFVTAENCALFPTVVVKGPEGGDKAAAVFAKWKETHGEAKSIELTAPDAASLDGSCVPLGDWLKAAKPRELPKSYTWSCLFDANGCTNPWTGSLILVTPGKRMEPTKLDVTYAADTNSVVIKATNLGELWVGINDDLLDLDKEVSIVVNDVTLHKKVFQRSVQEMLTKADDWAEYGRLFPVWVNCIVATQVPAAADKKDGGAAPAPGDGGKK
jgi:hypothetical protein